MSKINLEELKYVGPEVVDPQFAEHNEETPEEFIANVIAEEAEKKELPEEPQEVTEELTKVVDTVKEEDEQRKLESGIINVKKIKIYPKPSLNSVARTFSGNIEVIGQNENFKIVKYVRSGYGPVKGYIVDDLV